MSAPIKDELSQPAPPQFQGGHNKKKNTDPQIIKQVEDRVIANIDRAVKRKSALYKAIVKKLHDNDIGRCNVLSDFGPARDLSAWARVSRNDDKPELAMIMAIQAAHETFANHNKIDLFTRVIRGRNLEEWINKQIAAQQKPAKPAKEARQNIVLPSIEQPQAAAAESPNSERSVAPAVPVKTEPAQDPSDTAGTPSPKRQKREGSAPAPQVATANASTQTVAGAPDYLAASIASQVTAQVNASIAELLRGAVPAAARDAVSQVIEQGRLQQRPAEQQRLRQPTGSIGLQQRLRMMDAPFRQQAIVRGYSDGGHLMDRYGYHPGGHGGGHLG